jgi:putative transcriptional regulator
MVAQLLQDKVDATKYQIMIEIAAAKVNIQQRDIAQKLALSPQAVSKYMEDLISNKLVATDGRSKYKVTKKGVGWVLEKYKDLQNHFNQVKTIMTSIATCAAVAGSDISKGRKVGLIMNNGLLYTTAPGNSSATGIAVNSAKSGDDVGISNIEGILPLEMKPVKILSVPGIRRGGTKNADKNILKEEIDENNIIGAIGIEALISLKKIGIKPQYFYGVKEMTVEAVRSGLSVTIVSVDDEIPDLLKKLVEEYLDYRVINAAKT